MAPRRPSSPNTKMALPTKAALALGVALVGTIATTKSAVAETWNCGNDIDTLASTDYNSQGGGDIKSFSGIPGGTSTVSAWNSTDERYEVLSTTNGTSFSSLSSTYVATESDIADGDTFASGRDKTSGSYVLTVDTDQDGNSDGSYIVNSSHVPSQLSEDSSWGSAGSSTTAYLNVYNSSNSTVDLFAVTTSSSSVAQATSSQHEAASVYDVSGSRQFAYASGGLVRIDSSGSQTTMVSGSTAVPLQFLDADDTPNGHDWVVYLNGSTQLQVCYDSDSSTTPVDSDGDGETNDTDCDDTDASINSSAAEVCDEVDNDCDGLIDADDSDVTGLLTAYTDADEDGFGDDLTEEQVCELADNQVEGGGDCDDSNPDAQEWQAGYEDRDGDGYGDPATEGEFCPIPDDMVSNGDDCDDGNPDQWESCTSGGDDSVEFPEGESNTAILSDGTEVTGSGATVEIVDGTVVATVTPGGYLLGSTYSPLIASHSLGSAEHSNPGSANFGSPDSGTHDFEIFGGQVEGAASTSASGGSSSSYTGIDTSSHSETQGSDDESHQEEEYLPVSNTESHNAEASSDEFNVCDPETGEQLVLSDVDPATMGWALLCVKSTQAGFASGPEINNLPLPAGQMNEIADIESCDPATSETPDGTDTPDDTSKTQNNPNTQGGGCNTASGGAFGWAMTLPLVGMLLRRRQQWTSSKGDL